MDIGIYFGINVEFLGLFDGVLDFAGVSGVLGWRFCDFRVWESGDFARKIRGLPKLVSKWIWVIFAVIVMGQ